MNNITLDPIEKSPENYRLEWDGSSEILKIEFNRRYTRIKENGINKYITKVEIEFLNSKKKKAAQNITLIGNISTFGIVLIGILNFLDFSLPFYYFLGIMANWIIAIYVFNELSVNKIEREISFLKLRQDEFFSQYAAGMNKYNHLFKVILEYGWDDEAEKLQKQLEKEIWDKLNREQTNYPTMF